MTITAEPPFRTLPQYRYQASHLPRSPLTSELSVVGAMHDRSDEILTEEGLDFVCRLHGQFAGRRAELLAVRRSRSDQKHPFALSARDGSYSRGSDLASCAARSGPRGPALRDHRTDNPER
jgi:malate synthase